MRRESWGPSPDPLSLPSVPLRGRNHEKSKDVIRTDELLFGSCFFYVYVRTLFKLEISTEVNSFVELNIIMCLYIYCLIIRN